MLRASFVLILAAGAALTACKDKNGQAAKVEREAPVTAGTVGPDGVRRVAIDAGKDGYRPERIHGKPGEKLMLVFTRTVDAACLAQVKTPPPESKLVDLPKGTPVEVAVTVPATGELGFACGMDMFHGVIVASP